MEEYQIEDGRLEYRQQKYKARNKGVQILLSNGQAGADRIVKQEQDEISRNHIPSQSLY